MTEADIRSVIKNIVAQLLAPSESMTVPVEVSARHVHLSDYDVERLFGAGHKLTPKRELSQPDQFLCEERVTILTPKGELRNVALLGPTRKDTQVELSLTDAKALGIEAPIRQSGDLSGACDVYLVSERGMIAAPRSTIVAQNHIHMTQADADRYGVYDGERLSVRMNTTRPITFDDVIVRVNNNFKLAMHIDFDESNACAFKYGDQGLLLGRADAPSSKATVSKPEPPQESQHYGGLINESKARDIIKNCGKLIILPKSAILTPSALDVFRASGVHIEREGKTC